MSEFGENTMTGFENQAGDSFTNDESFGAEVIENGAPLLDVKMFMKWDLNSVEVSDVSLVDYMAIKGKAATYVPHTGARYQNRCFKKATCPVIERLVNAMMKGGARYNGQKMRAQRILRDAFEIMHLVTGENPVQLAVDAIVNSGPREDSTRVGSGGSVRRQAVDVSPLRRVNHGISLLTEGARIAAFRNIKSIAECLSDELIMAAKNSTNSYAVKKKEELERIAKSNR